MADGSQQVIVVYDAGTLLPSYRITIRWDEPMAEGTPPSYSISVPVNPF